MPSKVVASTSRAGRVRAQDATDRTKVAGADREPAIRAGIEQDRQRPLPHGQLHERRGRDRRGTLEVEPDGVAEVRNSSAEAAMVTVPAAGSIRQVPVCIRLAPMKPASVRQ